MSGVVTTDITFTQLENLFGGEEL